MSTLDWIAYHDNMKSTPAHCGQQWPGTGAYGNHLFSVLQTSLLTPRWKSTIPTLNTSDPAFITLDRFPVHIAPRSGTKTNSIHNDSVSRSKRSSISPAQKIMIKSAFYV